MFFGGVLQESSKCGGILWDKVGQTNRVYQGSFFFLFDKIPLIFIVLKLLLGVNDTLVQACKFYQGIIFTSIKSTPAKTGGSALLIYGSAIRLLHTQ